MIQKSRHSSLAIWYPTSTIVQQQQYSTVQQQSIAPPCIAAAMHQSVPALYMTQRRVHGDGGTDHGARDRVMAHVRSSLSKMSRHRPAAAGRRYKKKFRCFWEEHKQ